MQDCELTFAKPIILVILNEDPSYTIEYPSEKRSQWYTNVVELTPIECKCPEPQSIPPHFSRVRSIAPILDKYAFVSILACLYATVVASALAKGGSFEAFKVLSVSVGTHWNGDNTCVIGMDSDLPRLTP
jgi:hypothetical protein